LPPPAVCCLVDERTQLQCAQHANPQLQHHRTP
jgi:hypothetical protein